jgi:hypothetical protein
MAAAMTFQDVVSILNLLIISATGIVVTWYTWETRQLRRATLRQTALQIRPFLAIEYGEDMKIWVHNLGKGVARDIRFHDVRLGKGAEGASTFLTVAWQPIDFVSEGQRCELHGVGEFVTAAQRATSAQAMASWMTSFGPSGSAVYEFVVD